MTTFDPYSPDFRRNPYPYYDQLRENAPVFRFQRGSDPYWLVSRHEDCDNILRSRAFGRELKKIFTAEELPPRPKYPESVMPLVRMQRHWMMFRDPPDHTRLRMLVSKAFTPRRIESLREKIEATTHELIDTAQARGQMDIMADLALPLPLTVICELLGIPHENRDAFRKHSEYMLGINDIIPPSSEMMRLAGQAAQFYDALLREIITRRRTNPQDDLISALIEARDEEDRLSEEELVATSVLLLGAGFETTTNMIGLGVLSFLRHPEQFELLQSDLSLAGNAVEELLRFDSPIQMPGRRAAEDIELHGQRIGQGDQVGVLVGAANRDPERYDNPNTLDITRENIKPLSFGGGIHYCLGAPLARLEGEIVFRALAERLPNMTLAVEEDKLIFRDMIATRGLIELPVTL